MSTSQERYLKRERANVKREELEAEDNAAARLSDRFGSSSGIEQALRELDMRLKVANARILELEGKEQELLISHNELAASSVTLIKRDESIKKLQDDLDSWIRSTVVCFCLTQLITIDIMVRSYYYQSLLVLTCHIMPYRTQLRFRAP